MQNSFTGPENFNFLLLPIFKTAFIITGLIYIVFAIVVIRQIAVMKKTLITTISPLMTILGYLHLLFAVMILLFYLLVL